MGQYKLAGFFLYFINSCGGVFSSGLSIQIIQRIVSASGRALARPMYWSSNVRAYLMPWAFQTIASWTCCRRPNTFRPNCLDSFGSSTWTKVLSGGVYFFIFCFAHFKIYAEHITHWLSNERSTDLLHLDCALDTAIETKTWMFLKMRLILLLRSFTTSLADDELLMDNHRKGQNKLGHNRALVIQFRITEKKILTEALEYVEQRTKP